MISKLIVRAIFPEKVVGKIKEITDSLIIMSAKRRGSRKYDTRPIPINDVLKISTKANVKNLKGLKGADVEIILTPSMGEYQIIKGTDAIYEDKLYIITDRKGIRHISPIQHSQLITEEDSRKKGKESGKVKKKYSLEQINKFKKDRLIKLCKKMGVKVKGKEDEKTLREKLAKAVGY